MPAHAPTEPVHHGPNTFGPLYVVLDDLRILLGLTLKLFITVELSLSLSLSLSDEPSHESRTASTSRQTKLCTLYSANSRGGSAAGRSTTLEPSARKYVYPCAVSSTRSSWVLHRPTACGLHCPFAAAVATKSRSNLVPSPAQSSRSLRDQGSHGRTVSLRLLRFSSNCSHAWFRRTFVVTFCVRASHADVKPYLLRDAREPGDHVQDGAPHHVPRCHFSPNREAQRPGAPRLRSALPAR